VPEEISGLVARMVVTDPEAVTEVAELQSFAGAGAGAAEAKAVSASAAAAHTTHSSGFSHCRDIIVISHKNVTIEIR
jgi:hypothetical protein